MSISSRLFISLLVLLFLISCYSSPKQLIGKWVIPISGQVDQSWGFEIKKDGSAKSINASTLLYNKWILKKDTLLLFGKSVGLGQTIDFIDTLIVQNLNKNSLILKTTSGYELSYTLLE